jgi:hypothetical protein
MASSVCTEIKTYGNRLMQSTQMFIDTRGYGNHDIRVEHKADIIINSKVSINLCFSKATLLVTFEELTGTLNARSRPP